MRPYLTTSAFSTNSYRIILSVWLFLAPIVDHCHLNVFWLQIFLLRFLSIFLFLFFRAPFQVLGDIPIWEAFLGFWDLKMIFRCQDTEPYLIIYSLWNFIVRSLQNWPADRFWDFIINCHLKFLNVCWFFRHCCITKIVLAFWKLEKMTSNLKSRPISLITKSPSMIEAATTTSSNISIFSL